MRHIATFLGSFAYSGFFPFAPATFASFVFAIIYWFVPGGHYVASPFVVVATLLLSVPISTRMERDHGRDASCIVIDEVVGMQVIFLFAQPTFLGVVAAFFLFRIFDIVKPYPAARSQHWPGGLGVVADDVFAALYTRVVLIVISLVLPRVGSFV